MTKVDRSDDIVPVKTVGQTVGAAISKRRLEIQPTLKREDLARQVNMTSNELQTFEKGTANFDAGKLQKLQRVLKIKLLGDEKEIGQPTAFGPKKKVGDKK
jgi:putative transcription factor